MPYNLKLVSLHQLRVTAGENGRSKDEHDFHSSHLDPHMQQKMVRKRHCIGHRCLLQYGRRGDDVDFSIYVFRVGRHPLKITDRVPRGFNTGINS